DPVLRALSDGPQPHSAARRGKNRRDGLNSACAAARVKAGSQPGHSRPVCQWRSVALFCGRAFYAKSVSPSGQLRHQPAFLSACADALSVCNCARRVTMAPMALMNLVSSNINQWTMLAAMVSMLYCISHGSVTPIFFDEHQEAEILLTIAQSALGMLLLFNMRFAWYEALGIFVLWFIQFLVPTTHKLVTTLYLGWGALEVGFLVMRRK